jgi:hypothetical protein
LPLRQQANDQIPKWQAFVKTCQLPAKTGYFKNAFSSVAAACNQLIRNKLANALLLGHKISLALERSRTRADRVFFFESQRAEKVGARSGR